MQTQEPAQESGKAAPAQEQSAPGVAETAVAASQPLLDYPATILWIGFGGGAFVFLLVFVLLLRGRVGHARAPAAPKSPKEERRKAAKAPKKLKGKGEKDADFFQPAGENAEIAFEDDRPLGLDQGDLAARSSDMEAEVVIERGADEEASTHGRRPGPFAGIFGNNSRDDAADTRSAAAAVAEKARPAEAPQEAREHAFAEERRGGSIDVEVHDLKREDRLGWPAERALSIEEQRRQALEDVEKARAERELARAAAEDERRRQEEERRALAAANDERVYAEEERRAALDRAADQGASLEAQARFLRRDLARELDERFTSLADRIEIRLRERDGGRNSVATSEAIGALARDIDERFAGLTERLESRLIASGASGADGGPADDRIFAVSEMISRRMTENREAINAALAAMSNRVDQVAGAPADVKSLRDEIQSLKRSLSDRASGPTAPVVQLSDIVKNALPPTAFEMRAMLANNRRADCLIRLPHPPGPIAIDARFPVEAFDRLHASSGEDAQRAANEFRRTALRHIVDIAERLIVPEETAESALMFVPSESMYAELHARFPDIVQDSYRARVWIVSPTTLMATLHTIRAVLRDAQARESAELIHSEAQHVLSEVDALRRRVGALEENFEKTRHDVRDVISSTDQVYKRAETISNTRRSLVEGSFDRGSKRLPAEPGDQEPPARRPATGGEPGARKDDRPGDEDREPFPLR